ncbi:MAG TPA: hypothetical protein VK149_04350 [Sideroxyarcus sp.]|nr:hypothetical protein [Sideroxyarcus sp.]
MAKSLFGGANVTVEVHNEGITELLEANPDIKGLLMSVGKDVEAAAQSTAQDAQNGPGGTLDGYAEAGFTVEWDERSKRPRVNIRSNADPELSLRVHFYTQKRDGIGHLRKALKDGAT